MTCTHAATEVADACIEHCPICQRAEIERLTADNKQFQEANHWHRDQLAASEKDIERLRAALKPIADIPLWRDTYPDAKYDSVALVNPITVGIVLAARASLGH